MLFRIDPKIFQQNPDLQIGAIVIKGFNNAKRVSSVESLLRGICAQRAREMKNVEIFDHPAIRPWAAAYGKSGTNPHKFPPKLVRMVNDLCEGKELEKNSLLEELADYFALKHLISLSVEDIDWLCGDLQLTFTQGNEPFRARGTIHVELAGEGEAAYMDAGGITKRHWNHFDSERTKLTMKTENALILVEDLGTKHQDQFVEVLRELQNAVIQYIGGQIEPYILDEEHNVIDLGIQGRPHADDSKVPNQEKAHFIIENAKEQSL